ncbi:MAG: hypothetical protein AAFX87_09335 [Bacteroidota bacterium]
MIKVQELKIIAVGDNTNRGERDFKLVVGLDSKALRNSRSVAVKKSILFERSEFMDFQRNGLNFSFLITALTFLLRFWVKPKMKSLSGLSGLRKTN